MKTTTQYLSAIGLALTLATSGASAADPAPAKAETPKTEAAPKAAKKTAAEKEAVRAERKAARKEAKKASAAAGSETKPAEAAAAPAPAPAPAPAEEATLRLNFRGAPLDLVLNYLSEAAGYIIVLETSVRGTIDVWSNQPVTKTEAIGLLNSALNKNGYASVVNGRTLTIVSKEEASRQNIRVVTGSEPASIPLDAEIVTQIIPVRTISAASLLNDLSSLIPSSAKVTANAGGNALVMTDTQKNIRRVVEIVSALDGTVSASATIKVFALKYADAKALATTIKDLFQDAGTTGGNTGGRGGRGGFGGGFPGFGGGGDAGASASSSSGRNASAAKVAAVADEHSNSLIVSASDVQLNTIKALIEQVDTDVQDLTELRVFRLKNADPTETADLLTSLFPDTTSTQNTGGRGGGFAFGGGPFGQGGNRNASTATSDRSKKMGKVIAVPDARTGSVVVSAAKELMPQITEMVVQLDASNAKKQKVVVYNLENANTAEVEAVLRSLFEAQNSRNTQNNNQQNALQNRANQAGQNTGTGTGFGGSGLGGNGGGGFR